MKLADAEHKLQGHLVRHGLNIAVENQKGSVRSGVSKDGKTWRTVMKMPYGYFVGTKGHDGEDVDVFVGPKKDATHAFVVHQKKDDGSFDEHKVITGVTDEAEAKKRYLSHYNTDKFLGPVTKVTVEQLKELLTSGKKFPKLTKLSGALQSALLDELAQICESRAR